MKVRFLKRAAQQLRLQLEWWVENAGNGEVLELELRRVLERLKETPKSKDLAISEALWLLVR